MAGKGSSKGEHRGGRKKGTPNKRTKELVEILEAKGYSPVAELIRIASIAEKEYERVEEIFDAIQDKRASYEMTPLAEPNTCGFLKVMQSSASDIMQYTYPKRKALDATIKNKEQPLIVVHKTEWGSANETGDPDSDT